jgi:hypothetical protein
MARKSKVVLKKHIFIEKSNNSTQSTDHTWTGHGPHSMVILFLTRLLNPSTDIFKVITTGNSDFKK